MTTKQKEQPVDPFTENTETLEQLAAEASKNKERAEAASKVGQVLVNACAKVADNASIIPADLWPDLFHLRIAATALSGVGDQDREDGDRIASWLGTGVKMEIIRDAELVARIAKAIEAWSASAPTKTTGKAGSRGPRVPGTPSKFGPLGFKLNVTCQRCKDTVTTTESDNLNSARWMVKLHARKVHNETLERGSSSFTGVTEALESVMHGGKVSVQGGGYTVSRSVAGEAAA